MGIAWLLVGLVLIVGCGGDTRGFTITPRVIPTPTATEEPRPTETPRPEPTPTRTPAPTALYVGNTGGDGAVLRSAPVAGTRVAGLADGTRVTPQGEEQEVSGRRWLRVQDAAGRQGWIAADLLIPTPPTPRPPR